MSQKRKQISLELKLEVLNRFKSGEKSVDIARSLGLAPTTVRTICNRDADQIREFAKTATTLQSKQTSTKLRSSTMVKMESVLSIWIEEQNQSGIPLSNMAIRNKALSIFNDIQKDSPSSSGQNLEKFEASQGWFERFKTRTKLFNSAPKAESDNNEILTSQDEELNNEDFIHMNIECVLEEDVDKTEVVPEKKQLTAECILKAMQLISQAVYIFVDNDPDENRSSTVTRCIDNAINCYREIYLEKEAIKVQKDLYESTRKRNQSTEK